tara:strand:+ start:3616 stop:4818 length:1203 start_codon:yes stop_codon:yes gene_type:complete
MSYVDRIASWHSGKPTGDLGSSSLAPGDFPTISYDLNRLKAEIDRDAIVRGPATLWRYAALLPVENPAMAVSLAEGWTPMLATPSLGRHLGYERLFLKDEGRNPSGTFKDRGASVSVTRLRELGVTTVVHNSSGNAGGAWGLYAARAGMRCVNLMPDDVLPASLQQSALAGADTCILDGPWRHAGGMVADAVAARGWCDVRTLKEPYRLEGKKTMGLEIAEQLGWTLPDVIVYPTGGGLGAIAIYKAFEELQALGWIAPGPLPKLIVTQYEGCAPIVRAFETGAAHADLWPDIDVPPGGLKSTRPPGDQRVLEIVRQTGGTAVTVSTADAVDMVGTITRHEGIFPCPESATAVAGLRKARELGVIDGGERIVVVSTGAGMKSIPVLPAPDIRHVRPGEAL